VAVGVEVYKDILGGLRTREVELLRTFEVPFYVLERQDRRLDFVAENELLDEVLLGVPVDRVIAAEFRVEHFDARPPDLIGVGFEKVVEVPRHGQVLRRN
jgi:hypothetical protein